jgi:hypothetical protein
VVKILPVLQENGWIEDRLNRNQTIVLAKPYRSDSTFKPAGSTTAGTEVESLLRVGPTHAVFGSVGLEGGQELTFDALVECKLPSIRGRLLAVRKGHGRLVLGRKVGWRDISPPPAVGGRTAADIARATDQKPATVRGHLRQLAERKLAVKVGRHSYRLAWDPDQVAVEMGVDQSDAERKARHQADRVRLWEGRASLPAEHRMHVLRREVDGQVLYIYPGTGEVLWRRPALAPPVDP